MGQLAVSLPAKENFGGRTFSISKLMGLNIVSTSFIIKTHGMLCQKDRAEDNGLNKEL